MQRLAQIRSRTLVRLRTAVIFAVALLANTHSLFAQKFDSTELKTGISNSLAVIMMFGFVLGIAAVIAGGFKAPLMTSFGVAVVPVLLCLAYIFGLRHGKPPGYDRDCLEHWLSGTGFSPEVRPLGAPKHPLAED